MSPRVALNTNGLNRLLFLALQFHNDDHFRFVSVECFHANDERMDSDFAVESGFALDIAALEFKCVITCDKRSSSHSSFIALISPFPFLRGSRPPAQKVYAAISLICREFRTLLKEKYFQKCANVASW